MLTFCTRFLICNLFLIFFIILIAIIKRSLKKYLSGRTPYRLWLLLFILLAIPFLPVRPGSFAFLFSRLQSLTANTITPSGFSVSDANFPMQNFSLEEMNDFAISVSEKSPSLLNIILLLIWIAGMFAVIFLIIRERLRLYRLEKSALPLQNPLVRTLFSQCLNELHIKRKIPIYSTAFLKSPIIVGLIKPRIYLPIHLISDCDEKGMGHMLLHELQHYRHKDVFINYLSNLAGILYWFNPFVWYALKEIHLEKEIACDSSVLQILEESDYEAYGHTLINFAEKISLSAFPFYTGLGGSKKQMERRILNIANYSSKTFSQKLQEITLYVFAVTLILGLAPVLSTSVAGQEYTSVDNKTKQIIHTDFSSYFENYDGSFVLYNTDTDTWNIYNEEAASKRISPASTYKIFDALLSLESGVITPTSSYMAWDGEKEPFSAWERDQDLYSAMADSVNWYFRKLDAQLGIDTVKTFLHNIDYGNQTIGNNPELYWTDSSLKISPLEQVELLQKLYNNNFGNHISFSTENILAVKKAIQLSSTSDGTFYGKTGTGQVGGKDTNGWFVGCIEKSDNVYFFATNIQSETKASGSQAARITMSILKQLHIWEI